MHQFPAPRVRALLGRGCLSGKLKDGLISISFSLRKIVRATEHYLWEGGTGWCEVSHALLELLGLLHGVVPASCVQVRGQLPALQGAGAQLLWDTATRVDMPTWVVPGVCAGQPGCPPGEPCGERCCSWGQGQAALGKPGWS